MKEIVASGPVVIIQNKLLVTMDGKDDFYKIPGGRVETGEMLEQTCLRELEEETGFKGKIIRKLSTQILKRNPNTKEPMKISLNHYLCELEKIPNNLDPYQYNGHEVMWVDLSHLEDYSLAPNIHFLNSVGDLK